MADILSVERRAKAENEEYQALKMGCLPRNVYYEIITGTLQHKENGVPTNEYSKMYDKSRWAKLLEADFPISSHCCDVMKKKPIKKYSKETNRKAIIGVMASESRLRTQKYLKSGCNAFDSKDPTSNPMGFWTEQDVLLYIKKYNIEIASVYGDVVEDVSDTEMVENQMTISDIAGFENMELFDAKRLPLKTTGCNRTGCIFCAYGCHLEKGEGRFERLKHTHPKIYEYIFKPESDGGLGYKEKIDWINEKCNTNIRY